MRKMLDFLFRNGPFHVALAVILPLLLGEARLAKRRRKGS